MFGFHCRTRSLIPVADLAKYEKVDLALEPEDVEYEVTVETPRANKGQLAIIYALFLAEAIMASSLQPQLKMLLEKDDFCGDLSTSYLRSILDCAHAFGGIAGLFWGWLSDRIGRRPVALVGIFGMLCSCLSMGFATTLCACTVFRFLAGLLSSSIAVTTITMIGDISQDPSERVQNVARLPLIALCGSIGPVVESMVGGSLKAHGEVWEKYPLLSSQIACASLLLVIGVVVCAALEETLPISATPEGSLVVNGSDFDCEKATFLGQASEEADVLTIRVIDSTRPDPISISQIMRAPSLVVLLASFSLLSLHSATFDALLPHLGHSSTKRGGMGMPCDLIGLVIMLVRAVAAVLIFVTIPKFVKRLGLLRPYRVFSLVFPAVYVATPILAFFVSRSVTLTTLNATLALVFKNTLAGSAQVFVALLVLNTSPDPFSCGTIVGLMQFASLFRALAVGVSGASFYLSSDYSVATTNYSLWTAMAIFSVVGAALAWFVRDRPSVEKDFPSEVLKWETCYDAAGEVA